ncbi:hypothetical protein GCM10010123_07830 [Pilimelia anulata]|uniref:Hydrolytic protein n=2 Tax=Pilimelia anulata TaxID=53371 RepID=A0A8J3B7W1_9ACTN|nr:hypothetical protein GCM10010123_07830 [Pilimelia anulata]
MTAPTRASLEPADPTLRPGGETQCALTVRNTGDAVESYHLDVVGPAATWATVEPPDLTVFPGTEGHAMVTFRPPRSATAPAGPVPYGIRVAPREHPETTSVPEGTATLLPFADTTGEVVPRLSRSRRTGVHRIVIDNRGNVPLTVGLSAVDPDNALRFRLRPTGVVLPPGRSVLATLHARHRGLLWHGQPVSRPFQVIVTGEDGTPPTILPATAVQEPVLSRALLRPLALLLAAVLALAALWAFAVRPALDATARDAAAGAVADAERTAADAVARATAAEQRADEALAAADSPGTTPGTATRAAPRPLRERLAGVTALGATTTQTYTVPARRTVTVTDLVLQNPQGDLGRLDVLAAGQPLLTLSLANFRDLDYHWVSPIDVAAGQTIQLRVVCQRPGPTLGGESGDACREFVTLTGTSRAAR